MPEIEQSNVTLQSLTLMMDWHLALTWGMRLGVNTDHDILVQGALKVATESMENAVHFDLECLDFVPANKQ